MDVAIIARNSPYRFVIVSNRFFDGPSPFADNSGATSKFLKPGGNGFARKRFGCGRLCETTGRDVIALTSSIIRCRLDGALSRKLLLLASRHGQDARLSERYETAGLTGMGPARWWISLAIAFVMLSQPGALASNKGLEAIFGAWGRVDDNPEAHGCRLYANGTEGDYFVLSKDFVETGSGCVCLLEGSSPSGACFEVNLFCRCEDGITVRRRYQRLCPAEAPSRLDVTEDGAAITYERCKKRR